MLIILDTYILVYKSIRFVLRLILYYNNYAGI